MIKASEMQIKGSGGAERFLWCIISARWVPGVCRAWVMCRAWLGCMGRHSSTSPGAEAQTCRRLDQLCGAAPTSCRSFSSRSLVCFDLWLRVCVQRMLFSFCASRLRGFSSRLLHSLAYFPPRRQVFIILSPCVCFHHAFLHSST